MALVSLKIEAPEGAEAYEPSPYGAGTTIYLNDEQVEALGLSANPPKAGAKVNLRAVAIVESVTQEADADDAEEQGEASSVDVCMRLQITELEVTGGMVTPASIMYP